MAEKNWYAVRPLTELQELQAWEDLVSIARGEELDLPWRRLRILLDHELAAINYPVFTAGSVRSLDLTDKGLRYLDAKTPG